MRDSNVKSMASLVILLNKRFQVWAWSTRIKINITLLRGGPKSENTRFKMIMFLLLLLTKK